MYDYKKAMKEDVKFCLHDVSGYGWDLEDIDSLREQMNDDLWCEDSVTGNGSGSYTFNRAQAKAYVVENVDLAIEAVKEFCCEEEAFKHVMDNDWEWIDVTIRCYLLSQIIEEVLSENLQSEV